MTNNSNPRNLTSQMKFLIHQKEKKKKLHPKMFRAALFLTAKNWKQMLQMVNG